MIGAALVLGLVAGTCTGYLVQADREPTKLPPLSQPVLTQAKGEGPEPLSASQDRRVRTDGDLRKLLLKKPRGAKDAEWLGEAGRWLDLAGLAEYYTYPDEAFGDLLQDEFRRAVETAWEVDNSYTVEIRLAQFRQEDYPAAADASDDAQRWAEAVANKNWEIPGSGNGRAYVMTEPESGPGQVPVYGARAHAWRGDIAVDVWVTGLEPVSRKTIVNLAKRQLEQL
ncbi:hypothetical protein HTV45_27080 [Streptomyces sp. CHD11]|nr:hypothetical protein [Streptomyces sp. CHD11]